MLSLGRAALRLIFLVQVVVVGGADPLYLVDFFQICGRFSTNVVNSDRVSSLFILSISAFSSCWSALKGETFPRLLFTVRPPKPPPEFSVVFDLVFVLLIARAGFKVGIVLTTHMQSQRRRTRAKRDLMVKSQTKFIDLEMDVLTFTAIFVMLDTNLG